MAKIKTLSRLGSHVGEKKEVIKRYYCVEVLFDTSLVLKMTPYYDLMSVGVVARKNSINIELML